MTKELFKDDSYLNECDSVIEKLSENSVTLNQTIFYAEGGGQLGDTGYLIINNEEYRVSNTIRENNNIKHPCIGLKLFHHIILLLTSIPLFLLSNKYK